MSVYKVWDTLNAEQDEAVEIEADSSEEAAAEYAENDRDGWNDGLYHDISQPIAVYDGRQVQTFNVQAEMVPNFRAVLGESTP